MRSAMPDSWQHSGGAQARDEAGATAAHGAEWGAPVDTEGDVLAGLISQVK